MLSSAIVAHDPLGEFLDGTILNGPASIVRARDSGAVVLPYDLDHAEFGGYFRRGWGEGWKHLGTAARICPMLIHVAPERPWIYWVAWIVASNPNANGSVRLMSNTNGPNIQAGVLEAGFGDVLLNGRVQPSGVAIGGRRRVSVREPGFMALSLYVVGSDFAVQVSAVTQSRIDVAYP